MQNHLSVLINPAYIIRFHRLVLKKEALRQVLSGHFLLKPSLENRLVGYSVCHMNIHITCHITTVGTHACIIKYSGK